MINEMQKGNNSTFEYMFKRYTPSIYKKVSKVVYSDDTYKLVERQVFLLMDNKSDTANEVTNSHIY